MRNLLMVILLFTGLALQAKTKVPVPRDSIGGFWKRIVEVNADSTTFHILRQISNHGDIASFLDASQQLKTKDTVDAQKGFPFSDINVYKAIELLSNHLSKDSTQIKRKYLTKLVDTIIAAQEDDGYLYTYRTKNPARPHAWAGESRWVNEKDRSYEMYNFSKLVDAAEAFYRATGNRSLINAASRFAECICSETGSSKEMIKLVPGVQGAEYALARLYALTKNKKFLAQAEYFIANRCDTVSRNRYNSYYEFKLKQQWEKMFGGDQIPADIWKFVDSNGKWKETPARISSTGKNILYTDKNIWEYMEYLQKHKPAGEMFEAEGNTGHAIDMYRGMTAITKYTKDSTYSKNIKSIWKDIVSRKMSLIGGIGGENSVFGKGYAPFNNVIHETNAQISFMKWNLEMFDLYKDSKYIDVFERTLYNVFLASVSIDGKKFNTYNKAESYGGDSRREWFDYSTVPAEVACFISALPQYIYYTDRQDIYVNLYIDGTVPVKMAKSKVYIKQQTQYPWNGNMIKIKLLSKGEFNLNLRVPGWIRDEVMPERRYRYTQNEELPYSLLVNGQKTPVEVTDKGYINIKRKWLEGDSLILKFAISPRLVENNTPNEKYNGFVAVENGPLVYCVESADNAKTALNHILLNQKPFLKVESMKKFSVPPIEVFSIKTSAQELSFDPTGNLVVKPCQLTYIPYFLWGNRTEGCMSIWNPIEIGAVTPKPIPDISSTAKVMGNVITGLQFLNDGIKPIKGKSLRVPYCRWSQGAKAPREWISFTFKSVETVSKVTVYWHDDQPWGDCALPQSWQVMYQDSKNKWLPVTNITPYPIQKEVPSEVRFKTVKAKGIRLDILPTKERFSGIYEIIVE